MKASKRHTTWHQEPAIKLENDGLRTVVVPKMGGKLVSLFDKKNEVEWLVSSGDKPFQPVPYGASFVAQDMSGWDEMFPTIVACPYPAPGEYQGAELPDHGEVWTLPWSVEENMENKISLSVAGKALPYRLTRTMELTAPGTMKLHYRLLNRGREKMPYIWAPHPQFVCGQSGVIELPHQVRKVVNTIPEEWGWSEPETEFDWPQAVDPNGNTRRLDQVGPPDLNRARKFYVLPSVQMGQFRLIREESGAWLDMSWSPEDIPYFGLWVDEGALSHTSVVTPEPTTGFYDSLETAWSTEKVSVAEAGKEIAWEVIVQVGAE